MQKASPQTAASDNRKLAAIMFTDMVGFSRQMGADEAHMLRILEVHNQIIQHAVAEHHGHVIKTLGDAFVVDFPSVVNAVQCAQHIQAQLRTHNTTVEQDEQIHVRIGIHLGDIIQQNDDVLGDSVNIASRLQTLTEPDTICISQAVYQEVEKKLTLGTVVSLGRPQLKNIAQRFPVYALLPDTPKGIRQTLQVQRLKLSHRLHSGVFVLVFVSAALVAGIIAVRHLSFLTPNTQHASRNTQESLPLPDKPSIVVLPFTNMSNDPEQEYFSDGITEDLTTDLSKLSDLFVIARNSAFTYKGKAVKMQDVSRELGVQYIVEGSVRKIGEQVRITVQLAEATTGGHLWSERYDRPLKDIFSIQDETRQKIVTALKVKLTPDEQERFRQAPTDNLEAYDYYLRGLDAYWPLTKEENSRARQMWEQATALDPQYAAAYAWLSRTYSLAWGFSWSREPQTLQRAVEFAQRAIALNEALPAAHKALGIAYLRQNQHEQAIVEGERVIALSPNDDEGYANLGFFLNYAGGSEEAVDLVKRAMRLNPRYPAYYPMILGLAYYVMGRHEEAIAPLQDSLSRSPQFLTPHVILVGVYHSLGREEEAQAEAAEVLRLDPKYSAENIKAQPFKDQAILERWVTALRKAGLK
jgi:adenylate cyclase